MFCFVFFFHPWYGLNKFLPIDFPVCFFISNCFLALPERVLSLVFNTAFNQIKPVPFLHSSHTEGIMDGTRSAFFLISKVLCPYSGLSCTLVWFSILWLNTIAKSNLKEERAFFQPTFPSSSPRLRETMQEQEHRLPASSLVPPGPGHSLLSYTAQGHWPRVGNVHSGLGSSLPIINVLQTDLLPRWL